MAYIPGIRLMRLPAALIACAPNHFAARPIEMRAALALITDASEVLSPEQPLAAAADEQST